MKTNFLCFTTLCVFIILIISGCSDFLNQQPNALTSSSAFNNPVSLEKELLAAYKRTKINAGNNYWWAFGEITTDNAVKGGSSPSDQARILKLATFTEHASNTTLTPIWKYNYQGIHRANLIIKNIPKVNGLDQAKADRYMAEAKFLRALFYYRLVKIFGGVPLITKAHLKSYKVSRSSKEETYNLIENDSKDAIPVLPTKNELTKDAELGRASKGAAEALLTRVYLMQGNFSAAEKWAKKIIDSREYSLNPDYYSIFTQAQDLGSEAIFSITYGYNTKFNIANADDIYRNSRAFNGYGFCLPTQDLFDAFDPNDPRRRGTIYSNGDILPDGRVGDVGNSSTGYIDKKAYTPKELFHPGQSGRDRKVFRLGEIYLWYAEAANENGHTQIALKYLNKVRERAREGNPNILPDITVTNKAKLRKIIWHEERVEYALEGKRFFDLVRTDRAAKVLHAYAKKYNTEKGANFKKDKNEIFPIPESQIQLSHGTLKQNPGYK